ncbi:hypothetical protein GCM10008904_14490 [Paraclostridium ghonii]|uniref:Uncharacterized protein n=1 Tax=Paraclostridium ghonii TaxID=29358 RepID=A0ABU0N0N6_9FIRM|nr:hypothetical protein [Paeniclostridium ghonii]MDQ0556433.1 hypothetical protein [Paeniclostridium ghonii]
MAVKDITKKEIISYHVSSTLSMDLGLRPIEDIGNLYTKSELKECIIHSDQ